MRQGRVEKGERGSRPLYFAELLLCIWLLFVCVCVFNSSHSKLTFVGLQFTTFRRMCVIKMKSSHAD